MMNLFISIVSLWLILNNIWQGIQCSEPTIVKPLQETEGRNDHFSLIFFSLGQYFC